jgi:hypothetical protein
MGVLDRGPPDDGFAVPLEEDLYLARVRGHPLVVEYLVVVYERLVIVRRIGPIT